MRCRLLPHEACLRTFDATPAITAADRSTGDDCFIVRVTVGAMNQLEAVIDSLAAFGAVSTSIVLATYPSKPLAVR